MTYPPNTIALPYKCGDERCACSKPFTELPYRGDLTVHPTESHGRWSADVTSDYGIVDHFRGGHDLNEVLAMVHAAYPDAEFDP